LIGPGSQGGDKIDAQGFKGCAHLLNADGSLCDGFRDTYAQAFVILAGAWRYFAFKDEDALRVAIQTLDLLDTHMKADNGGWLEGLPASLPRRQNPHMHMFEALLSLYDATKNDLYLERATEIFDLFKSTFFDSENQVLIEFFDQDWEPSENGGGPIEPGHMMEWCWLLREYESRTDADVSEYANVLYDKAIKAGYNCDLGLLCDRTNLDGKILSPSLRIWVQLEYLKASIAQASAGVKKAESMIDKIIDMLFQTYLDVPVKGGWGDQLDKSGKICSPNMTTSTFYHLMCAAAEVDKFKNTH
jgi:mannose-6-phosphate isomerase